MPVPGHHHELRDTALQPPAHRLRADLRLVDQQVGEPRHPGPVAHRRGEQLGELAGVAPAAAALVEDQGHDGAQPAFVRILLTRD